MTEHKITPVDSCTFQPIGILHSNARWRYEAPRQAEFDAPPCEIEIYPGHNYEAALEDLNGFERIWVIFVFHLNQTWNPKVTPPLAPENRKYGVFSTRSPHRPNRIGLSCVRLLAVEGRNLLIEAGDMLDGTPILDIKPYIPEADAFPDAKAGWRDKLDLKPWQLLFAEEFIVKNKMLVRLGQPDLENFCRIQLLRDPFNSAKKRIDLLENENFAIHCRTWTILYHADTSSHSIEIKDVKSNYKPEELSPDSPDKYGDKDAHRAFVQAFPEVMP